MSAIIMPEIIIYKTLEAIVNYIRKDIQNGDNNILYKLLGKDSDGNDVRMNRYNYYQQAKNIFMNEHNMSINFGYNFEVAKIVALHIILPSEQAGNSAIGQDEGYMEGDVFTQDFSSNYQVMITSNNSSECMLAYHILKAMLISLIPHLELSGLRLNKFSGNDIMFRDELMPNGLFHKVLNLSFNYELIVPQLTVNEIVKGVIIEGHLIASIKDDCYYHCDENKDNY